MREQRVGEGCAWIAEEANKYRESMEAIRSGETSGESEREGVASSGREMRRRGTEGSQVGQRGGRVVGKRVRAKREADEG